MIQWEWRTFAELTPAQLYDALQLRERVFTIGQRCTDPDMDNVDRHALHLLGYDGDKLVGYMRVYKNDDAQKLGRIVVNPDYQGNGHGRALMLEAINHLRARHPNQTIEMSAQQYLQKFYESLGFHAEGEIYLEAGIEHVYMKLPPNCYSSS